MATETNAVWLGARHMLRIARGAGTRIWGREGTAWVTVDGDPRDVILEPGQSFVVEQDAPTIVSAFGAEATIALEPSDGAGAELVLHVAGGAWHFRGEPGAGILNGILGLGRSLRRFASARAEAGKRPWSAVGSGALASIAASYPASRLLRFR